MFPGRDPRCAEVLCPFLERECPEGEQVALLCSVYFSAGSDPMAEPLEMWTTCALARRMFFGDVFPSQRSNGGGS